MIPVVAVPNAQSPAPIQTAAFSGVPTETSLSRIPFYAVPSNPKSPESHNNTRPVGDSLSGASGGGSAISGAPSSGGSILSGTTGVLNFPSTTLFMTQMMGQGSAGSSDTSLIRSFFSSFMPSSPAPDMELVERFAMSKFLPSNAFKPLPKPAGLEPLAPQQAQAQPAPQSVAQANARVSVEQANQALQQQQVSQVRQLNVAPQAPVANTSAPVVASSTSSRNTNNLDRPNPSLVKPQGVNAYISTLSRNVSNLEEVTDNPIRVNL